MSKKDSTFLGLHIPKDISEGLDKDAKRHFRNKSQHILWIINEYLLETSSKILSKERNKTYTKEDIQIMKDKYNRNNKFKKEE